MSMLLQALAIAKEVHKNQKRWDGSPYIEHPKAVAKSLKDQGYNEQYQIVGILHDVLEDCDPAERGNILNKICQIFDKKIAISMMFITKAPEDSYADYIKQVKSDQIARQVKVADLMHNLLDLKPGQRRDKYELAKLYLG